MLNVSQTAIENEFYMVDLPFLIQKKHEQQNAELLVKLQLLIASNNRAMEESDYKQFINAITPKEIKADMNKFDRDKFEQLRRMQG
ncbi:hypothetical protein QT711_11235 [Sporosarcina saromensis]|uniref:Uncharacterized protein n=1 Tax=Sporosarcina saromensis TaxID=359365 RepID=A0ABU4G9Y4_9BACL|nr:hypothetical protein [Sporosarcina saromensis]MDW0113761.1 hypothetical protein [Sporosarcina saromensis]